jgi:antitoxin HicB
MNRAHIGSSLDSLLEEEGILEEVTERALLRVVAWQIEQQMKEQNITQAEMARRMHTSRNQVKRIIGAEDQDVRMSTLQRAARALDRELVVQLV